MLTVWSPGRAAAGVGGAAVCCDCCTLTFRVAGPGDGSAAARGNAACQRFEARAFRGSRRGGRRRRLRHRSRRRHHRTGRLRHGSGRLRHRGRRLRHRRGRPTGALPLLLSAAALFFGLRSRLCGRGRRRSLVTHGVHLHAVEPLLFGGRQFHRAQIVVPRLDRLAQLGVGISAKGIGGRVAGVMLNDLGQRSTAPA